MIFNRVVIASDHGGYDLKEKIVSYCVKNNIETINLGTSDSVTSVDYPDYAKILCEYILSHENCCGILICKSGIGMSISANRFKNIRAALAYCPKIAELSRMHNNANVLCFGASFIDEQTALKCVQYFLETEFEGGRHNNRILKIENI